MAKNSPSTLSRTMDAQERQWRAQDALRTLARAAEIQANKRLMGDVKREARQQIQSIAKVAGKPAPARKK